MKFIEKIDWDNVDYDKVMGDFVTLADGREHYIELDLRHWFLMKFKIDQGHSVESIAQEAFESMVEGFGEGYYDAEHMNELIRVGLVTYVSGWLEACKGR